MRRVFPLIILLTTPSVWAAIRLDDEGTNQGYVSVLNCVGTNLDCTRSGITGTLTFTGGGTPGLTLNATQVTGLTFNTGVAVSGTAPTFTTSITDPLVIGGTAAGSSLALQSTSGVGTTDFIRFLVGNNGGTEAFRVSTAGNVVIGTTTDPTATLSIKGNANQAHLYIVGNATQTANLITVRNSGGTDLFDVTNLGYGQFGDFQGIPPSTTQGMSFGYNAGVNSNTFESIKVYRAAGSQNYLGIGAGNGAGHIEAAANDAPTSHGSFWLGTYNGTTQLQQLMIDQNGVGFLNNTYASQRNLGIDGTAARTFGMERHTTSNTAGNTLTVGAGGATSGATDKSGGALLLTPGLSTGNALPGLIRVQGTDLSATSGTGDRSMVDRLIPNAAKVLTNNSAIAIVNATIAIGSTIGGVLRYTIEVTDGTDVQVETGFAVYSSYNKAATVSGTITEVNSQQNLSVGTLATTWAISNANPAVISINANSSLTPSTGYPRITYAIENFGQQAIAIQ